MKRLVCPKCHGSFFYPDLDDSTPVCIYCGWSEVDRIEMSRLLLRDSSGRPNEPFLKAARERLEW